MKQTLRPAPLPLLLSVLLLSLLLLPALPGMAQSALIPADAIADPYQLFRIGNTAYAYAGHKELYALDPSGQATPIQGDFPNNMFFLPGENDILAVDRITGAVFKFNSVGGSLAYEPYRQLDWTGMEDAGISIEKAAMAGGRIFLLAQDFESSSFYSLFIFDLESGAQLPDRIKDARDVCAYEEEQILVQTTSLGTIDKLHVCDISTLQMQKLLDAPEENIAGLAYDNESRTVALTGNGAVYLSREGESFQEGGYLNVNMNGMTVRAELLPGAIYTAIVPHESVTVYDLKSAASARPLHIAGYNLDPDVVRAFVKANPTIPVVYVQKNLSDADELALQLVLRNDDVDIYAMNTGTPICAAMLDKGFALDLSGEAALMNIVSAMYPRVAEQVKREGNLYALPIDVSCFGALGYNPELFAKENIAIPNTLFELMDLMEDRAMGNEPLINSMSGTSEAVLRQILYTYLSAATAKGPAMPFDKDTFRRLILRWEEIAPLLGNTGPISPLPETPALFCDRFFFLPGSGSFLTEGYSLLPLSIDAGFQKILPVNLNVMIVNPASKNQADALRFLSFYMENLPGRQKVTLYPCESAPVEDPESRKRETNAQQDISLFSDKLLTCAPEEKKQLTEQLELAKADLEYWQEHMWTIGPEEIKAYQEIAGMMIFGREDVGFFTRDRQVLDLCVQLSNGGISGTRFCDAFIGMWEMAQREQ